MIDIRVSIDGCPYRIQGVGMVDIQRLDSGNVAIRKASDNASLDIWLDEEELERQRRVIAAVRKNEEIYRREVQEAYCSIIGPLFRN